MSNVCKSCGVRSGMGVEFSSCCATEVLLKLQQDHHARAIRCTTTPAQTDDAIGRLRRPQWEYLDEHDEWRPVATEYGDGAERAFNEGQSTAEVKTRQNIYDLDLQGMAQTNKATRQRRRIRRNMVVDGVAALELISRLQQEKQAAEQNVRAAEQQRQQDALAAEWERQAAEENVRATEQRRQQDAQSAERERQAAAELLQERTEQLVAKDNELRAAKNENQVALLSELPDVETLSQFSTNSRFFYNRVLGDGSKPFNAVSECFYRSLTQHRESFSSTTWCDTLQVEITAISEIINPTLLSKYRLARTELSERRPNGCAPLPHMSATKCKVDDGCLNLNEYLLFHGCPYNSVGSILETGLDPQRGGEYAGRMFGTGAYFAENASKSDLYTTCSACSSFKDCRHAEQERCMLVARVLLGNSKEVTTENCSEYQRAPEGHDSVTALTKSNGGKVDHPEFITYKEQMALVRWLVFYRHTRQCQCHNCKYRRSP